MVFEFCTGRCYNSVTLLRELKQRKEAVEEGLRLIMTHGFRWPISNVPLLPRVVIFDPVLLRQPLRAHADVFGIPRDCRTFLDHLMYGPDVMTMLGALNQPGRRRSTPTFGPTLAFLRDSCEGILPTCSSTRVTTPGTRNGNVWKWNCTRFVIF